MEERIFTSGVPGLRMESILRKDRFEMEVVHAHTFLEIYYLYGGSSVYHFGGGRYPIEKGAFVFMAPGCMHRTSGCDCERVLLEIDPTFLRRYDGALSFLRAEGGAVLQLTASGQQKVEALLDCLAECLREKPAGYEEKLRLYLAGVIACAGDHGRAVSSGREYQSPRLRQAERAIRFIEQLYTQEITLEDIASALFMNKYYLSHLFREVTGFTVFSYVIAVRLQHARTLLITTDMRVSDLCGQVGFASQAHFNRLFLREVGMSPLRFRKTGKPAADAETK